MKKYIICNFARSDWGKTQTLLKVIDLLKKTTSPIIEEMIGDKDKFAVFEINKKTVVVNTQGDPYSYQEEGLKRAVRENAAVIVCASRVKGTTVNCIYEIAKCGYEVVWFSNFYADSIGLSIIPSLHEITAEAIEKLVLSIV